MYPSHKNLKFGGKDETSQEVKKSKWKSIYTFLTFYDGEVAQSPKRRHVLGKIIESFVPGMQKVVHYTTVLPFGFSTKLRTHTRNQKEIKLLTS